MLADVYVPVGESPKQGACQSRGKNIRRAGIGGAIKSCAAAVLAGDDRASVQIYKPKLQTARRANFTRLRNLIW
jgi:hypothetical protein